MYAVYSATKAYIDSFSRSLSLELRGSGVVVQCQVPYLVVTKLSKLRRPSLFIPTPSAYARAAVAWIGAQFPGVWGVHRPHATTLTGLTIPSGRGATTVVPYLAHRFQNGVVHALPAWLLETLLLKHQQGMRAKALRKAAKAE